MSKLALSGRPYVLFDPADQQHRKWFAEFSKTGGWGNCPVRFVVENQGMGNMVAIMQRMLINYYAAREFPKIYSDKVS